MLWMVHKMQIHPPFQHKHLGKKYTNSVGILHFGAGSGFCYAISYALDGAQNADPSTTST